MEIKVSGRKTPVTDALRAHVDEKIGEALKVFDIEPMTADVVLRYEKNPSNPNPAIVEPGGARAPLTAEVVLRSATPPAHPPPAIVEVTGRARGSGSRGAEHGADL